jgi:hypothetical protein
MNSATSSTASLPPGVREIVDEFLKNFYTWELMKAESRGKNTYVSFKAGIFGDLHAKQMQKLARLHGLRVSGYGVVPHYTGKLLVTFVLAPRRKEVRE